MQSTAIISTKRKPSNLILPRQHRSLRAAGDHGSVFAEITGQAFAHEWLPIGFAPSQFVLSHAQFQATIGYVNRNQIAGFDQGDGAAAGRSLAKGGRRFSTAR